MAHFKRLLNLTRWARKPGSLQRLFMVSSAAPSSASKSGNWYCRMLRRSVLTESCSSLSQGNRAQIRRTTKAYQTHCFCFAAVGERTLYEHLSSVERAASTWPCPSIRRSSLSKALALFRQAHSALQPLRSAQKNRRPRARGSTKSRQANHLAWHPLSLFGALLVVFGDPLSVNS